MGSAAQMEINSRHVRYQCQPNDVASLGRIREPKTSDRPRTPYAVRCSSPARLASTSKTGSKAAFYSPAQRHKARTVRSRGKPGTAHKTMNLSPRKTRREPSE